MNIYVANLLLVYDVVIALLSVAFYQECISINQSHLEGLLMYGVVCAMQERNSAAETFFEAATNVAPHSVIAWTMRSLFYDGIENDIGKSSHIILNTL